MTYQKNIGLAWAEISPDDRLEARAWWPNASDDVWMLAAWFDVPFKSAAYAAAAISPGIPWVGTIQTLESLLDAYNRGHDMPRGSGHLTFGYRGRERAWGILGTGDTTLCRGPKVEAVAACLMGDQTAVPVDRHLIRAATGAASDGASVKVMREIADATRAAAFHLGEEARAVQAGIWIVGSRRKKAA